MGLRSRVEWRGIVGFGVGGKDNACEKGYDVYYLNFLPSALYIT
jgi:hypothetical protein